MITRVLTVCLAILFGATTAMGDVVSDAKLSKAMVESCVEQKRDVCVVFASTQIMTSIPALEYMYEEDPDGLQNVVSEFEKASYRVSSAGRPDFRKFLAENAIWTMDYYNERFLSNTQPDYSYEKVRHFYAAYQLQRADACHQLQNSPCAESSLWYVNNARKQDYWGLITERFAMDEVKSAEMVDTLFKAYEGRF